MRVLLIVNSLKNVRLHRMPLIEALLKHGYEVHVAAPRDDDERIPPGCLFHSYPLSRGGMNPIAECISLVQLTSVVRSVRPDILHCFALKPVLYGAIAARLAGAKQVLCSLTGLGHVFTADSLRMRLLRRAVITAFRFLFRDGRIIVIVQNRDDLDFLRSQKVLPAQRLKLIRGSGLTTHTFELLGDPHGPLTVVLAARMIAEKGVREFIAASRTLASEGQHIKMVLVGDVDSANPSSLTAKEIESAVTEGVVEWWGWQEDMMSVLARTHIACLPSYREGLPRFLMEAAAAGRAIVTTDVPGCREVVVHGESGILIPPRDPKALARALARLAVEPELRLRLGTSARIRAEQLFSTKKFEEHMVPLYGGNNEGL